MGEPAATLTGARPEIDAGFEVEAGEERVAWWRRVSPCRGAEILVAVVSAAIAVAWILVDRTTPPWDEARYLLDTLQWVQALHSGGLGGLVNAFFTVDTAYGPGYLAAVFPIFLAFGPSDQGALAANVVLWIVLLLSVGSIARQLFGPVAGPVAMAVTAISPILLWLLHHALVDLGAATWTCLSVVAMLRSRHFTRPLPAALAGLCAGVGLLTKVSVVIFLAGPALVIGVRALVRLRSASTAKRWRVMGNLALALATLLAVAGPWYLTNLQSTIGYIHSAAFGVGAAGTGPANPLAPSAIAQVILMIVSDTPWIVVAASLLLAALLVWERRGAKSVSRPGRVWSWLVLLAMAGLPVAAVATSQDQASRYAAVTFPALAIIFAALVATTRRRPVQVAAVAAVLAFGVAQIAVSQMPIGNSYQRGKLVWVRHGWYGMDFFGPAYPYANSAGDDGTPIMAALESVAKARPLRVMIAQDDHTTNLNTLRWLSATRHDDFTFELPPVVVADPAQLSTYDVALYIPSAEVVRRNNTARADILNAETPSTVFGAQLFTIFAHARHEVRLPGGTTAWVLER